MAATLHNNANSGSTTSTAETIGGIADAVGRTVHSVADEGREVGEQLMAVTGSLKATLVQSIKEQPLPTLAVAVGLGFLIGAFWKS
jgi:hypothetical protein